MKELHLTTDELRNICNELDKASNLLGVRVRTRDSNVILERMTTGWIFVEPLDAHLVITVD